MGKRYSKHLRKINKLRDVFVEELITDAGLKVYEGDGFQPGTSVAYSVSEVPTYSHMLKVQYFPPMYINVHPGSSTYESMVGGHVADGQDSLIKLLTEEGIPQLLRNEHIFISIS